MVKDDDAEGDTGGRRRRENVMNVEHAFSTVSIFTIY